jgi:hypothetical protein
LLSAALLFANIIVDRGVELHPGRLQLGVDLAAEFGVLSPRRGSNHGFLAIS